MHLTRLPYGGKRRCREEGNTKDETERMAPWKKEAFACDLTRSFFRRMPAMEGGGRLNTTCGRVLEACFPRMHAGSFLFPATSEASKRGFDSAPIPPCSRVLPCIAKRDTKARRAQNVFAPIDG